ncbi:MAG: TraG family conjugative transposon ATPase [Bacteroidetes bacterium]|nr:TraG family conjugative transposon ATPase [Bacteroidota bacterium]
MERNWMQALPVYGMEGECLLSRQGDYTVAFRVTNPEIFTLSEQDYQSLHQAFIKAIHSLPAGTVFHKQDWYVKSEYQPEPTDRKGWLGTASDRHFEGRPYLNHHSYIYLTRKVSPRRPSTSALSGLLRPHLFPQRAVNKASIDEFLGFCGQFRQILEDSGFISLERIGKDELWSTHQQAGLIERYCSLETGSIPLLKDVGFKNGLSVGNQSCQLFSLADAEDLPSVCSTCIDYEPYSTDRTKMPLGFASGLGLFLPYNHIYNQYVFIEEPAATLKQLETKQRRALSLSGYSRENIATHDAINNFLQEAVTDQKAPVKAHFNLQVWTNHQQEFQEIINKTNAALARIGASPRLEVIGAPQIWAAGIPGNAGDFPQNETFDIFLDQAVCFFQMETNYRSSASTFGFRLGDRLTGRPLHLDIDDEPRAAGVTANGNMVVISGSGGGKSFLMNHIVREYYDQEAHVVIIDIGHSYEIQCELHGGYYYTYDESKPISFNPFYLAAGDVWDTEKKESLKALLLALWKKADEPNKRIEYVVLSDALQLYFAKLAANGGIFPCFNTFYEFLQQEFKATLLGDGVKEKDFDIENFLYVLRPYYSGGEFEHLLNARENLDILQQRFVVFELDSIKSHPVLFPVVTLVIMEIFMSKMRKLKGVRKLIVIEEAWRAIAQGGMAEYIKYLYKTIRKFFGKAIVVTQEIEDVISSETIRQAIINNADTKLLLDQSKFQNKFDQLQDFLGISEKQKTEILSLNKGHEPGRSYKDCWIGLGATSSKVYRVEVSPEEYYVYTSEQREKKLVREFITKAGNVKDGVKLLLNTLKGATVLLFFFLFGSSTLNAQDPTSVISSGITKVIKAFDLQVQKKQTQTILLQQAQKIIENALTQLDLEDIRSWVQAQKDLYSDYFQELWQVKPVVAGYHKTAEIIQNQEKIISEYNQAWNRLKSDPNFSTEELAAMNRLYSGLLNETAKNLDMLYAVIRSFSLQMSDEERMQVIDTVGDSMNKTLSDLERLNNQNFLLSIQRSRERNNIDLLKKMYGL